MDSHNETDITGRAAFVLSQFHGRAGRVLDVGCGAGGMLGMLLGHADELWGVDVDAAAIAEARLRFPQVAFGEHSGTTIDAADAYFDAVILSDVIEHVHDDEKLPLMREIRRVLRAGGLLVFTAPYAGTLAWLDPMDVKRRAPRAYAVYRRLSGHEPATAPEIGHRHVDAGELVRMMEGFELETVRYSGVVTPMLSWLVLAAQHLHLEGLMWKLAALRSWEDSIRVPRRLAQNVRLTARRSA